MLHHAYLIKGWLLDKDPPKEVAEALQAIIKGIGSAEPVAIRGNPVELQIVPQVHREEAEAAKPEHSEATAAALDPAVTDEPKPRRKHNMSPEAREAARQRMIDMQARKRAEREADNASPVPEHHRPNFTDAELRITVPTPRRKSQLTDADWPEIKTMLADGRSREAIASDYDEEVEDLDFFIASSERREAKSPGEAGASPSGVASGATQNPTW